MGTIKYRYCISKGSRFQTKHLFELDSFNLGARSRSQGQRCCNATPFLPEWPLSDMSRWKCGNGMWSSTWFGYLEVRLWHAAINTTNMTIVAIMVSESCFFAISDVLERCYSWLLSRALIRILTALTELMDLEQKGAIQMLVGNACACVRTHICQSIISRTGCFRLYLLFIVYISRSPIERTLPQPVWISWTMTDSDGAHDEWPSLLVHIDRLMKPWKLAGNASTLVLWSGSHVKPKAFTDKANVFYSKQPCFWRF